MHCIFFWLRFLAGLFFIFLLRSLHLQFLLFGAILPILSDTQFFSFFPFFVHSPEIRLFCFSFWVSLSFFYPLPIFYLYVLKSVKMTVFDTNCSMMTSFVDIFDAAAFQSRFNSYNLSLTWFLQPGRRLQLYAIKESWKEWRKDYCGGSLRWKISIFTEWRSGILQAWIWTGLIVSNQNSVGPYVYYKQQP